MTTLLSLIIHNTHFCLPNLLNMKYFIVTKTIFTRDCIAVSFDRHRGSADSALAERKVIVIRCTSNTEAMHVTTFIHHTLFLIWSSWQWPSVRCGIWKLSNLSSQIIQPTSKDTRYKIQITNEMFLGKKQNGNSCPPPTWHGLHTLRRISFFRS